MAKSQIDLSQNFYNDNQIGSNSISQSKISDKGKEIKEEQNVKQGNEKERKTESGENLTMLFGGIFQENLWTWVQENASDRSGFKEWNNIFLYIIIYRHDQNELLFANEALYVFFCVGGVVCLCL